MRLKDKAIVITGGASGIGRAAALCCAQEGAKVVIADINKKAGEEVVKEVVGLGAWCWFVPTDVSQEKQVANLMREAEKLMGRINVLINAAGVLYGGFVPVEEFEESVWDKVIDINLKGSFLAAKHVVPAMKRAGGGIIILIASGAGVRGGSSSVAYGSSKGGVHGLAMTLEPKLAPDNIRVIDVCPGNIETPLKLGAIQQQAERTGESEESLRARQALGDPMGVGKVLAFLASSDADYVRGTVFTR